MKTRTDFVSNSSSSSFILGNNKLFTFYQVSPKDIYDALISLYGEDECKDFQNKDWNKNHELPFTIYVLPNDLEQAIKDYGVTLSEFTAKSLFGEYALENYKIFLNTLCDAYNINLYTGSKDEIDEINGNKYESTIPSAVEEVVIKVRKQLDIKTMKDAIKSKQATLFVHFHENEIWRLKDVCEYGPADIDEYSTFMNQDEIKVAKSRKWTTKSSSNFRVYEVLLAKLVEMKKIKVNDKIVLDKLYPTLYNSTYSAEAFANESELGFIAHEG